jgi:phenylacetate-CoA ligase
METSVLEKWIEQKLQGLGSSLNLNQLRDYQLERLNETLAWVKEKSPFYRKRLSSIRNVFFSDLSQLSQVPFTTPDDVRLHHLDMLCVSHGEVARIITLQTSGTSDAPKRLYFSQKDLELTIDFFHHGMAGLVKPGQRVLILLPGKTPDSVGDLLKRGLARLSVEGHIHWPVLDLDSILSKIAELNIDCLVGAPSQIFALCRYEAGVRLKPNPIKTILLSTDYVPKVVVNEIEKMWGSNVFEHYGMTEMGFGGGLACGAHQGYHLREGDLWVEIIDPESGETLPPGKEGEVVFTTLTRRAMPLIRYRTGDLAAWQPEPCPCGSRLPLLGKVSGRRESDSKKDTMLSMPILDETLLKLPGVISFQASISVMDEDGTLNLVLFCEEKNAEALKKTAHGAVSQMLYQGHHRIRNILVHVSPPEALHWDASGMIKRNIGKKE